MSEKPAQIPYPITSVPFDAVSLESGFWGDRLATNRTATVPHVLDRCESTGRIRNFERASLEDPGPWCSDYPYDDSDVYKCIEGASHVLRTHPDEALNEKLDRWIAAIEGAQEADGYLYPFARFEFDADAHGRTRDWWYGPGRWDKVHLHSHELYNVGHLYEAAVAHYRATGSRRLLDVAIRNADLVADTFAPRADQRKSVPGHQEIELGLMRLYEVTGEKKYLDTAAFFLAGRGDPAFGLEGGTYSQNHMPVKEQRTAVGHAVRAAYMYSAMADAGVALEDDGYFTAIDAVWRDVVSSKLYVTGGIGSTGETEGFQDAFVLPNETAYCETCAGIANVLWNQRMFLRHGEAKYLDVLERTLYNNVLAGVSLDGTAFFYPNSLASNGGTTRRSWFGCACCPSNVARFLPQIPGLAFAARNDTVFVNLFMAGEASMEVGGTSLRLRLETNYPWDGQVRIFVHPERPVELSFRIRLPGWCRNQPLPSTLYSYYHAVEDVDVFRLAGEVYRPDVEAGFGAVRRTWKDGDSIEIDFPMPVRLVQADEQVDADRGRLAIERGPLVYAVEETDLRADPADLRLSVEEPMRAQWAGELLGGIQVVQGRARLGDTMRDFTAVPYFIWSNRGEGAMRVWLCRE